MPSKERVAKHELSFDPLHRFNALAKTLASPRGAKSVEHLKVLRQSDPCYGSLAPAKVRTAKTEFSYEPQTRFNALAKSLKAPRGAKTTEHLEILRLSDPMYGSLMPAQERVGKHELPYDPSRRFVALSRLMDAPRGAKSLEHLENLRVNDPSYGSLVPQRGSSAARKWTELGPAAGWLKEEEEEELEESGSGESGSEDYLQKRPSVGRLPRILSNQMMHFSDEDDEEDAEWRPSPRVHAWAPPSPKRNPNFFPPAGVRRLSRDDYDLADDASLRSAARTSVERSSERSSNDTIASFLDDHDMHASGEFSAEAIRASFKEALGPSLSPLSSDSRRTEGKQASFKADHQKAKADHQMKTGGAASSSSSLPAAREVQ